ncbi:methyltransferase domain-containing protein [Halioxenophilus sp. WMMB6]|uniref:methyltransferase domain-containing protein n=1 Tax=Halioxenophilus sp. WMMB6 TaxID=3073815 RepID=UPI00295E7DAD|nr:methyltransferase domain-containing protein [Halioxenophilus sp. WMMB6]
MNYYQQNHQALYAQYTSIEPEQLHQPWLHLLPTVPGIACDLGAGSGRDANWLAALGWDVTAVEPCQALRALAKANSHANVCWLDDTLPELKRVRALGQRYNLILISAVWMHLSPPQRARAFRIVSELLAPGGLLVMSVRHGPDDGRQFFDVPIGELQAQARERALSEALYVKTGDALGRGAVYWETLCLRLLDDGTGGLPLLRHIIVNDNKSSTYKLGLLRVLSRIAEGAPGMVLNRTDNTVEIPFGLVGLYWLKLYLPLITKHGLRQHPNSDRGYGFAKEDFYFLKKFSPFDLNLGATFYGADAAALVGAIRDCCANIKAMPAHYIQYPGQNRPVFECERETVRNGNKPFQLNKESLARFGLFRVPAALWQTLGQYACWVEPAIVTEWEALLAGWEARYSGDIYRRALEWNEGKRDTNQVRGRINTLTGQGEVVRCVWSDKTLKGDAYAVDHCFPWSRWQNNDLWNLLPATLSVNANKSDKLPSAPQLHHSRDLIIDWWQRGYMESPMSEMFLIQAEAALPLMGSNTSDLGDLYEAVCHQRVTLKTNQQLAEWACITPR